MMVRRRWNPKNLMVFLTVVLLTIMALNIFSILSPTEASNTKVYKSIVVHQGDNLWEMAVNYMPNRDPRQAVDDIKRINNLNNENLIPGQLIEVPLER